VFCYLPTLENWTRYVTSLTNSAVVEKLSQKEAVNVLEIIKLLCEEL